MRFKKWSAGSENTALAFITDLTISLITDGSVVIPDAILIPRNANAKQTIAHELKGPFKPTKGNVAAPV